MITLTVSVPQVAQVIAADFTALQLQKSTTKSAAGPFQNVGGQVPLDPNTTTYTVVDVTGGYGDWYATAFVEADGVTTTPLSTPQPGYLSDLCQSVRDLLGVSPLEASDATIQGIAYLPQALAQVRQRLATFDTTLAAGGDTANLCLAALAHLTAAKMCPRMTVVVVDSEQIKDYRFQRNRQMDWSQTQQELMATYEQLITLADGDVASDDAVYVSPLALAGATRSGLDTTGGLWPAGPDPVESAPYEATLDAFANPNVPYSPNPSAIN